MTTELEAPTEAVGVEATDGLPARELVRLVWAVSIPILVVEVSETVIHVTDTIFLARVGTTELAAIALGDLAIELLMVVAIGLAEASQIVIARRFGEGRPDAVGPTFMTGFGLVLVVSSGLAVGLALAAPAIGGLLTESRNVADALEDFLSIAAFGIVPFALNLAYSSLYVGLARTRPLVGAALLLAGTNVVVSYLLIFGSLGLPELGIRGAAVGFVAAESVACLYLTGHLLLGLDVGRFGLERSSAPRQRGIVRSLLRLGAPVSAQAGIEILWWLGFFLIIQQIGETALAWSNIAYACFALLVIPTDAFSETAYSLVSNVIGRGRADSIRALVGKVLLGAYSVTVPLAAITLLFPRTVLGLFTDDPATIDGSLDTLLVVALAMLVVIPADLWVAALFGTGDTDAGVVLELLRAAAMLGFGYVAALQLHLDLQYVWLAVPLASLLTLPLAYAWVRSGWWRRRLI